jgi:hypothetical protein
VHPRRWRDRLDADRRPARAPRRPASRLGRDRPGARRSRSSVSAHDEDNGWPVVPSSWPAHPRIDHWHVDHRPAARPRHRPLHLHWRAPDDPRRGRHAPLQPTPTSSRQRRPAAGGFVVSGEPATANASMSPPRWPPSWSSSPPGSPGARESLPRVRGDGDVSELEELRRRLDARESAATRTLSSMTDRDVAEWRVATRGHTQTLGALREAQLKQGQTVNRANATLRERPRPSARWPPGGCGSFRHTGRVGWQAFQCPGRSPSRG